MPATGKSKNPDARFPRLNWLSPQTEIRPIS